MEKWMVSSLVYRDDDRTRLFEEWHGLFETEADAKDYAKDKTMARIRSIRIVNGE